MFPTELRVNWPLGSGEEAKNRFSRWPPPWISNRKDLANFDLQVTLMLPTKFQLAWPSGSGEEAKNRFSRWPLIGTIIAIFDLQVMLPTKFQVNWHFGSGEEAKKKFSRWPPQQPSSISYRNHFSCF